MNIDLINREAVWELLDITCPLGIDNDDIAAAFRAAPTIDAILVIRCKDCKHMTRSPWNNPEFGWCKLYGHNRKMDYYCASGEQEVKRGE